MPLPGRLCSRPRLLAIGCATGATLAGVGYMSAAGAPPSYSAVNLGALAIGLAAARVLILLQNGSGRGVPGGASALALGLALLATAWIGLSVEGASRWVRVGALIVQPSLLAVPMLAMIFARARDPLSTSGVLVAALALAWQPDRAMAAALALGVGAVAFARPDRASITAAAGAAMGFAATLSRADDLPAVSYVDRIFYTSFGVGAMAGLAVLAGAALLLSPAVAGVIGRPAHRRTYAAFGATWFGIIAAAALGNYPTPVVGYGGSAIIGYLLSLAFLPGRVGGAASAARPRERQVGEERDRGRPLRAAFPW